MNLLGTEHDRLEARAAKAVDGECWRVDWQPTPETHVSADVAGVWWALEFEGFFVEVFFSLKNYVPYVQNVADYDWVEVFWGDFALKDGCFGGDFLQICRRHVFKLTTEFAECGALGCYHENVLEYGHFILD